MHSKTKGTQYSTPPTYHTDLLAHRQSEWSYIWHITNQRIQWLRRPTALLLRQCMFSRSRRRPCGGKSFWHSWTHEQIYFWPRSSLCKQSDIQWLGWCVPAFSLTKGHLDYSIDSHITCACIHSIRSDWILHSTHAQDSFPQAGSRRTAVAGSFLWNHRKKECHCPSSLCDNHVHHIRNVQRCSFVLLFVGRLTWMPRQFVVGGDVKRSAGGGSITTSWNEYSATYRTGVWHAPDNNTIFSPACILGQLSDWAA